MSLLLDQPAAVVELPANTSACRRAFRPTFRAATSQLAIQLTSSDRWVRSAGVSPENSEPPDVRQHLRICTASGKKLMADTVGIDSAAGGDSEQLSDPDLVGNVVLGQTFSTSGGDSGEGSSSSQHPVVYGPPDEHATGVAAPSPSRLVRHPVVVSVVTRAGAAWITRSGETVDDPLVLWTSDATGVRRRALSAPVIASYLPPAYLSPTGRLLQGAASPRKTDVVLRLTGSRLRVVVGFVDGFNAQAKLSQIAFDEQVELTPVLPEATTVPPERATDSAATCPNDRWVNDCASALTLPDR